MRRSLEDSWEYKIHYDITSRLNNSIHKYMMSKLFSKGLAFTITRNKFPYSNYRNLSHYLLWIQPEYERLWTESRAKTTAYNFAHQKRKKLIRFFRNQSTNCSILSIKHWHLFLL